jgi:hypothetical protein
LKTTRFYVLALAVSSAIASDCTPTSLFDAPRFMPVDHGAARKMVASDFNDDGLLDLAIAHSISNGSISVLFNLGNGDFTEIDLPSPAGGSFRALDAGDIDNDGDVDIVAWGFNSPNPRIEQFLNTGFGGFIPGGTATVGGNVRHLSLGDLTADGSLDLIVADSSKNRILIRRNDGTGSFSEIATVIGIVSLTDVDIADMNSDGHADIIYSSSGSGTGIAINSGPPSFIFSNSGRVFFRGLSWSRLASGDLDGDGDLDVVLSNLTTSSIVIALNNGDGILSIAGTYPTTNSLVDVQIADLNGDGSLDIAASTSSGNQGSESDDVRVLFNDGSAIFVSAADYTTGASEAIALEDFNNDGNIDLAASNAFIERSVLYLNICKRLNVCAEADIAEPFGVLDLSDIAAFIDAFTGNCR